VTLLSVRGISKRSAASRPSTTFPSMSLGVDQGADRAERGGKTTIFNVVSGFLPPDSGEIVFGGAEIQALSSCEVATRGMVRTFQNIRLSRR